MGSTSRSSTSARSDIETNDLRRGEGFGVRPMAVTRTRARMPGASRGWLTAHRGFLLRLSNAKTQHRQGLVHLQIVTHRQIETFRLGYRLTARVAKKVGMNRSTKKRGLGCLSS